MTDQLILNIVCHMYVTVTYIRLENMLGDLAVICVIKLGGVVTHACYASLIYGVGRCLHAFNTANPKYLYIFAFMQDLFHPSNTFSLLPASDIVSRPVYVSGNFLTGFSLKGRGSLTDECEKY